jgi:hypothetical protein
MNDFLNGIFRIWEKLPDESKTAFVDNLSIKDKSAVKIGKQILEYYVDVSHDLKKREEELKLQQEENLKQKRGRKKDDTSSVNQNPFAGHPLEAFLRNIPPEAIQAVLSNLAQNQNGNTNMYPKQQAGRKPQSKKKEDEDIIDMNEDDVIDAVWSERNTQNSQSKK